MIKTALAVPPGWFADRIYESVRTEYILVRAPDGLMATLDLEQRVFRAGLVITGKPVTKTLTAISRGPYAGRGWQQKLCDDAVAWIKKLQKT